MCLLTFDAPASGTGQAQRSTAAGGVTWDMDPDLAVCMQDIYWVVFSSCTAVGEVKEDGLEEISANTTRSFGDAELS